MRLFSRAPSQLATEQTRTAFESEAFPHFRQIHAAAYRLVRRQAEAEDLTQEVFLQAWKSFGNFEPGTNCRAWLYRILFNVHHQWLRKTAPRLLEETSEYALESIEARPETPPGIADEDVAAAVAKLDPKHRELVLLSYVEGFTYKEIASILSVPVGTVMSRLFRARTALRGLLAASRATPEPARTLDGKEGLA